MTIAAHIKAAVFDRAGGTCECTNKGHTTHFGHCRTKVFRHAGYYHYRRLPAQGGREGMDNCVVICEPCHRQSLSTHEN